MLGPPVQVEYKPDEGDSSEHAQQTPQTVPTPEEMRGTPISATRLLGFTTMASSSAPTSERRPLRPLKDLDKQWLNAMLKPDAKKMRECIDFFTNPQSSIQAKLAALDELNFYAEMRENANNMKHPTVDGLVPIVDGLRNENEEIRMRCAWILATALQNNPEFQQDMMALDGMHRLLESLSLELIKKSDLETVGKIVYAISSLLHLNPKAQEDFLSSHGFEYISQIVRMSPEEILQFKTHSPLHAVETGEPQTIKTEEEATAQENRTEEVPRNIIAHIEVVDVDEKIKAKEDYYKKVGVKKEAPFDLWLRLVNKIVFMMFKLMIDNDDYKVFFAKHKELTDTMLHLLETTEDIHLKEKILQNIRTMLSPVDSNKQPEILNLLRSYSSLKTILDNQKAQLEKNPDTGMKEILTQLIHEIQEILQM